MYNIYFIIIIWKKLIQDCHLLICTSKIIHQNNFSYCKTLTTVQKYKSQSLTDLSNVMIYNKYPWNISHTCNSFSHCFGSSLPLLKTDRSTVLNIVQPINKMTTSTSSSDFESICSDSELINKSGEIKLPTINPKHSICLSREVTKEPSDTEMKSESFSEFSNIKNVESLEKSYLHKNNTLANSFISNHNCSASYSKSISPALPSFPPPPPPLPPTLFLPSKVSTLNNSFTESQQPYCHELKDQIAPSQIINGTYASESDVNKLKPFRWTKISTLQQASVWSNNNNECTKDSDHNDTPERYSRNCINLAKLNDLFVQHQKSPMGIPEVKISSNKDSQLSPVSISKQITEGEPNYDRFPQKYFDNTNIQENNQTISQTSNCKLLDSVNFHATRGRSLSSSRAMKFTQKCHETNLLESHRCLNINIFLRQFRHFHVNLLDLINQCDGSSVGSERLKDLIKLLPTDQEIKSLMTFQGDVSYLDPAERFLYDLVRIPKYYLKIDSMLLMEEFQPTINWIKSSLNNVLKTSQEIITSPLICELLQTVLEIGNYMNKGGNLGSATGFKISSLLKLSEVRSNDPKITLLHFLVQELKTNNPQMLLITETMPQLKEASDVSLDSIIKEINRFRSRLQNMAQYVDEETFEEQSRIREFIEQSNHELDDVQTQVKIAQDLEIKCAQYFCECPTRFRITECLQTFNLFFEKMKSTEHEIKEYEQTNKDRLEKVIRNVSLNNTNTKYDDKRCRPVENNSKLNQDDHNIMINMIASNLSNLKIVHNRSRSRPSTNKLNSFASSNSLSKFIIESDKSNKDENNTDESNMVSKSSNIPHLMSLCENRNKIHNNNIRIKSHQPSEQSRKNTRCQFTDNESERERRPWLQIQSQPTNSSVNDINHKSDESKRNPNSEEPICHLNERIKRLTLRFNKN
ncbi:FH2 domain-containing protein [Schistosoma japonicum]|uniref:FH2 domain-containing protein n=1 Tax=Schistosoma japonicum TaxID=6182 RepID=A0A4Z2DNS9_SCHJA|nr:FH2 domain-containing protein [Schistosoma japonicum]